jgi:hypothetical protein
MYHYLLPPALSVKCIECKQKIKNSRYVTSVRLQVSCSQVRKGFQ